jgi:hypothetical protein
VILPAHVYPERAELAGSVPERFLEITRNIEEERARIVGFLHDALDPEGVIAVPTHDVTPVSHQDRPGHARERALLSPRRA